MSTGDGKTFGTPFSIVGCTMKEKEKKMYTLLLLVDLSGIYQSRTARFPSGFCLAGDAQGFSGSAVVCGSGNYDYSGGLSVPV